MAQPLKILIVEHRQEEAELLARELRSAGFEPDCRRVETEAAYRDGLQSGVELVLANDQTPQLSGLRALELLRHGGMEIPFIMVSGTPGEDLAVRAMKRGATDYLLRSGLSRLGVAVGQALDEAGRKREHGLTEQRLRESLAGLALAQEVGNFGSWEIDLAPSTDPNRKPLRWSDQCFRIFGFAPREVEVTNDLFFSRVHPDDQEAVWAAVSAAIENRQRYLIDHRIVLRNGQVRQVREAAQVIFDTVTGRPLKMVGSVHDITDSLAAEASLREKNTLIRIAGRMTRTGGWAVELPGRHLSWSDEMFEILEYPPGPTPPLPEALALYDEPWRSQIIAVFEASAQAGIPFDVEVQTRTARGRIIWIRVCGEAERRGDGSIQRVQGAFQDMTEQKRAAAELDEKRAFFETLAANSVLGILVVDQAGRKVFQNPRMVELWNIPPAFASDVDDRKQFEFVTSRTKDPAQFAARVRHLYAHPDESSQDEIEAVDGTVLDRYSAPVLAPDGRNFGRIWSFHDITERKRTEQKLRENERFVRGALDGLTAHIAILDEQGTILAVNEAWRAFADRNDLTWERGGEGANYLTVCDRAHAAGSEDAKAVSAAIREVLEEKRTRYEAEYPCHLVTERRWFLVRLTRFPGDGPRRVVVAHENITRRRLQEEELRTSEERFRQVVENIREVFWIRDVVQNRIIYVSEGYEEIWGQPRARLYESPAHWTESIFPADRDELVRTSLEKQIAGTYDETFRIVRPDGSLRWVRARAFPVRNAAGVVYRVAGVAEDITERKRAELRLELQYAVTAVLAEAVPATEMNLRILETLCRGLQLDLAALWMVDRSMRVLRCAEIWHPPSTEFREFAEANRSMTFPVGLGLLGSVWASGRPEWSGDVPQDARFERQLAAAGLPLRGWIGFPIRIRNETLGVIEFFSAQVPPLDEEMLTMLGALGAQIGLFIERRQLAEQFQQIQKLEALGTLAGGIAHDFNNILGAIIGYTELTKIQVSEDAAANEFLDAVLEGARRAVDLVRQILAFSRQETQQRMLVQLRHLVTGPIKLLRATIPASIEFRLELAHDLPVVLADATQVHQVIMNLGTNAAHAMKDRPGRLTFRLENFAVDVELAAAHPGLRPGPYVRLGVSDNGCGMDAVTLERIFDPFFTTKAPGEGTGLGLAVVHGIMQGHDGIVTVQSEPGVGSTFHLYFPAHGAEAAPSVAIPAEVPVGQGQRVLIVDDEKPLALLGRSVLEDLGYVVTTSSNAADALALVRADLAAFDLIITDLTMPGMTGLDFARQVLKLRPELPIILMTGYSASLTAERVQGLGLRELLLKPLTQQSLGTAAARALSEKPSP